MKFSDYYLSQASRTLSTILGLLVGIVTAFLFGWAVGVIIGCSVALIASVILPFIVYRADAPYLKIKATLLKPFLIDQRVRFTVTGGLANGYLILTSNSIVLVSLDHGEHRAEFSRDDVKKITMEGDTGLNIFINQTQCIRVLSVYCKEMLEIFRQNGWT